MRLQSQINAERRYERKRPRRPTILVDDEMIATIDSIRRDGESRRACLHRALGFLIQFDDNGGK